MIRLIYDRALVDEFIHRLDPTADIFLEYANVLGWGDPLRGVFVAVATGDGEAYMHVYIEPEARGREALRAGREAHEFLRRSGIRLHGMTPVDRPEALWYAKACGMQEVARDERYVVTEG